MSPSPTTTDSPSPTPTVTVTTTAPAPTVTVTSTVTSSPSPKPTQSTLTPTPTATVTITAPPSVVPTPSPGSGSSGGLSVPLLIVGVVVLVALIGAVIGLISALAGRKKVLKSFLQSCALDTSKYVNECAKLRSEYQNGLQNPSFVRTYWNTLFDTATSVSTKWQDAAANTGAGSGRANNPYYLFSQTVTAHKDAMVAWVESLESGAETTKVAAASVNNVEVSLVTMITEKFPEVVRPNG